MAKSKNERKEVDPIVPRESHDARELLKNHLASLISKVENPETINLLEKAARERPGVMNEIISSAYTHAEKLGFQGDKKELWIAEYSCRRYYNGAGKQ